jgi:hypothetical protein
VNLVQKCTKICVKIQLKNLAGGRANSGKFCNKVESAIVENDAVLVLGISLCVLHGLMERLLARHLCESGSDLLFSKATTFLVYAIVRLGIV